MWQFIGMIAHEHFKQAEAVDRIVLSVAGRPSQLLKLKRWSVNHEPLPDFAMQIFRQVRNSGIELTENWRERYQALMMPIGHPYRPVFAPPFDITSG